MTPAVTSHHGGLSCASQYAFADHLLLYYRPSYQYAFVCASVLYTPCCASYSEVTITVVVIIIISSSSSSSLLFGYVVYMLQRNLCRTSATSITHQFRITQGQMLLIVSAWMVSYSVSNYLFIFLFYLFIYFTVKHGLHFIKAIAVQQGCKNT